MAMKPEWMPERFPDDDESPTVRLRRKFLEMDRAAFIDRKLFVSTSEENDSASISADEIRKLIGTLEETLKKSKDR
jgi:hypothetical protein